VRYCAQAGWCVRYERTDGLCSGAAHRACGIVRYALSGRSSSRLLRACALERAERSCSGLLRGSVRGALSERYSSGLLRACARERARRTERTLQQWAATRVRAGVCATRGAAHVRTGMRDCALRAERTLKQ